MQSDRSCVFSPGWRGEHPRQQPGWQPGKALMNQYWQGLAPDLVLAL
jgi:hypothetical protein